MTDTLQFSVVKDCLARRLIALQPPAERGSDADTVTASDLDDFTSYLALEVWPDLPEPLRTASHDTRDSAPGPDDLHLQTMALSRAFVDSLVSYALAADDDDALDLLRKVLEDYVKDACAPPPPWGATRTTECEICERAVPLTYHHLIPRSTHARVLKKKWHPESMLNSVAWLCRPCHSAVHHVAPNETLARELYTVDLLLQREDIQKWRKYAAKQRYGVKRG